MIFEEYNFMLFFLGISSCCVYACFQLEFNDETWLNVESIKYLEKGTIECRNVGINVLWQN